MMSGRSHRFRSLAGLSLVWLAVPGCRPPADSSPPPNQKPIEVAADPLARPPSVRFVDVTEASGVRFVHCNGAVGEKRLPETMGSGVAVLDYDGDGDQDLFFVNSRPWPDSSPTTGPLPTQSLYQNDGHGRFRDVSTEAGVAKSFYGQGVAVGDYDNDGDPDLYVTALGPGHLWRNEKGVFHDVTAQAHADGGGGWQASAAWFDLENDGDLDLFVCRYVDWSADSDRARRSLLAGGEPAYDSPTDFGGASSLLLRNDGGTFVEVGESAGISVRAPQGRKPLGKALGVAPCDVDGDGLVDLAVANDTVQNFFFHNLGGGRFEEVGIMQGLAFDQAGGTRGAMGLAWGDPMGDGAWALAVANFAGEMMGLYVADEPGSMQFTDRANLLGLGSATQSPMKFGLYFFDYDNDGRPDLLCANGHLESGIRLAEPDQSYPQPAQLFWNSGRVGRLLFLPVGPGHAGPDLFRPMVGRGSAFGDFDGDGDLDVVLTANGGPARLLRNDGGSRQGWIRLNLEGTVSNRPALGARVSLRVGDRVQHRQLFPAMSYLSSSELPLTFGLGDDRTARDVTIHWPSGQVTKLPELEGGRSHHLKEP